MRTLVYVLSAITSLICALLLIKSYLVKRVRLLLWSAICFLGLTASNVLLYLDREVYPDVDLSLWRNLPALAGFVCILVGLVWDSDARH